VTLRDFNVTPVRGKRPIGSPERRGEEDEEAAEDRILYGRRFRGGRDAGRTWNRDNPRRSYERDERGSANSARCTDPDEYIALRAFAARSDDPYPAPPFSPFLPPRRVPRPRDSSAIVIRGRDERRANE
jgi:hypothetical protein